MSILSIFLRSVSFVCLCGVLMGCNVPWESHDSTTSRSQSSNPLEEVSLAFDWNKQTDTFLCQSIGANNHLLSVGVAFDPRNRAQNTAALDAVIDDINGAMPDAVRIVGREDRLAMVTVEMVDCAVLGTLRALPAVEFVEAKYVTPLSPQAVFDAVLALPLWAELATEPVVNPGEYVAEDTDLTYSAYLRQMDEVTADRMDRHGMSRIFDEFQFYGAPTVGVAVIDNGVFEDDVAYLSQGEGEFRAAGYVRAFGDEQPDGPHPQRYDLFGLIPLMDDMFAHGTIQTTQVYSMAPHINITSVRASPYVFWFMPAQFQGVVDAIMALAEDPSVRVISSSMGTVLHVHEIARAIAYFNARDKLFVSAGGTSMPYLRDVVKVVFPANLPSTLTVTGIQHTEETAGEFLLGDIAHGGKEIDFVIDHSRDSSQAVSSMAGMIGLLWSYDPSLTREEMIDLLIHASSNYRDKGKKDAVFGWGKVDMYGAFLAVSGG